MDIIQNSITANSNRIVTTISTDNEKDFLYISIKDNGKGMSKEFLENVIDPFTTSRTTRKVGLGIPLFKESAERAEGFLSIESELGKGTLVSVSYKISHIDRLPLGDIAQTFSQLVMASPEIEFELKMNNGSDSIQINTVEIQDTLGEVPITNFEVIEWINNYITESIKCIFGGVLDEILS